MSEDRRIFRPGFPGPGIDADIDIDTALPGPLTLARLYHSPSSIALAERCMHAWASRYIDGIRPPEPTWADITAKRVEPTPSQRSRALGKEIHARAEAWYLSEFEPKNYVRPVWHDLPGKILGSGIGFMPHPSECVPLETFVEEPIGLTPLPDERPEHAPPVALDIGGVLWAGYRDLLAYPTRSERARLKMPAGHRWLQCDWKSSASIERYALDDAGLLKDVQANLYAIDACEQLEIDSIPSRWVYFETKRVRIADARMVVHGYEEARRVMEPRVRLARELDTIVRSSDAPKNPRACGDFGGCEFHVKAGGHCDVKRSTGALIQARVLRAPKTKKKRRKSTMALDPEIERDFKNAMANDGDDDEPPRRGRKKRPAKKAGKKKRRRMRREEEPEADEPEVDDRTPDQFELPHVHAHAEDADDEPEAEPDEPPRRGRRRKKRVSKISADDRTHAERAAAASPRPQKTTRRRRSNIVVDTAKLLSLQAELAKIEERREEILEAIRLVVAGKPLD